MTQRSPAKPNPAETTRPQRSLAAPRPFWLPPLAVRALLLGSLVLAAACTERRPEPQPPTATTEPPVGAPPVSRPSSSAPVGVPVATAAPANSVAQRLPAASLRQGDRTLYEGKSEFSHLAVQDRDSKRHLLFVRDGRNLVVESSMDLDRPDELEVAYTRVMFVSYLFKPEQRRALIIGLGGGSMVRFSNRYFPEVNVDAVELDPLITRVADSYFGVTNGPMARIITMDGFKFLATTGERYDTIYLDAFVKPSGDTDDEGMPLRFKTRDFLKGLTAKLTDGGVVVINLNEQPNLKSDIAVIRESFPASYFFPVPNTGNLIAVGAIRAVTDVQLRANGATIDKRGEHGFSFAALAELKR